SEPWPHRIGRDAPALDRSAPKLGEAPGDRSTCSVRRRNPPAGASESLMAYFVTGATGFIGRHLVEQLLKRDGDVYVLVREGSTDKLQGLIDRWGPEAKERVKPVTGDLAEPRLGVSDEEVAKLRETGIDHYFHL